MKILRKSQNLRYVLYESGRIGREVRKWIATEAFHPKDEEYAELLAEIEAANSNEDAAE